MLDKVKVVLDRFAPNDIMDQLDDDEGSGRRPCPLDKFCTYKEIREARKELADFIYRMESLEK